MLDFVRNSKKLVQIILLLIILVFAVWGTGTALDGVGSNEVATVGRSKITQQEFQQALYKQGEILRQQAGAQYNPETMNRPEVRLAVLDNLIEKRLIDLYASESRIRLSDEQLKQMLAGIPQFQENGKFSPSLFEQYAKGAGMSEAVFVELIRQDFARTIAMIPVEGAAMASRAGGDAWLSAALEQRQISEMTLKPDAFLAKVTLAPDAVKNFYESNQHRFEIPEQVRFEFVILSQHELEQKVTVSDADVKAWYESHQAQFTLAEERHASHILILADKDAKPEVAKAAEEKAQGLLAQVRKNPADFAKLAKQYSQDPGSAGKGGDVGEVKPGTMVKPFEDAVFALSKDGQISDLVRTDYGFHIVRLSLKPARVKPLAEVKAEIVAAIKSQSTAKKFAEAADKFTNTVYEQPDSLKPVVEQFGLQAQQSPWMAKGRIPPGMNEKLAAALFSDDAIKNKRNTEAVEIAPNTLMAARVIEHKAASLLPLSEVQTQIEAKLKRDQAIKLAAADAEARLAKLNAGEASAATWGNTRTVQRAGAQGISGAALRAIFTAPTDKLPAYVSASSPDGSATLFRIEKVKPYAADAKGEDATAAMLRQQYERMTTTLDSAAWLASLRERFKVEINQKALMVKAGEQ